MGKSTLFNRLVGEKRSLTGKEPGVTRDRVAKSIEWHDRPLTLVDTAGFQPDHPAPDPDFILEQVDEMIGGADCILFVVDGGEGITSLDREIAERLYSHSEAVILVVNKIDPGRKAQKFLADFYELGFSEILPVSALHGRNINQLKDLILDQIPDSAPPVPTDGIRISLVGRPNVGKSTMFNSILGQNRMMVSDQPGTTRDVVDISFEYDDQRFYLVDTAGLRKKSLVDEGVEQSGVAQAIQAINYSDIVCLLLDWNERVTNQDQRIGGIIRDTYRGCMILINKADQANADIEDNWLIHVRKRLYFLNFAPILFTSGEQRRGFAGIFETAREIDREMNRWVPEQELTNGFLDLKPKISWPSPDARDVILKRIRQIDINPITFEIEANDPSKLSQQDHRHLFHLLQEHLTIELSPIKLKLVESFSHDR